MQCYICRQKLSPNNTHHFYKRMCIECGNYNWLKREEYAPLTGYKALVTGGRIKIGYETALKLLRSGSFVIITTRFPVDAVKRYSTEPDFNQWVHRLKIFQIDFRQLESVFAFISYLYDSLEHLDILINNAAQTVRHDFHYYELLHEAEEDEYNLLPEKMKKLITKQLEVSNFATLQTSLDNLMSLSHLHLKSGLEDKKGITTQEKKTLCDTNDVLQKNSWISKACEISAVELIEVQLINSIVPYILCTGLRQLLERSPHEYKHIVNVSAMEGQFSKKRKNCFHPHTNMAKASLNMLTRTSAQEFNNTGILMNSVDTGWITDENPDWLRMQNQKRGFIPPLDAKDGASRLCDPIFSSILRERHMYGAFLKDYTLTGW